MNRPARLAYLQRLLYRSPAGYRSSELAALCETSQRTINRDLEELQAEPFRLPLVQGEGWRWQLMEGHRFTLPPIYLSLGEAAALYLAARLLVRVSDEPNPYVGRALAALAEALPVEVGAQVQMVAAAHLGEAGDAFARVFEVITLGWATGRKVRIRHQSLHGREPHEYILSPYLIEPSTVGYATYVIGHASYFDAVRTFKLERILEAELLGEAFDVPDEYRGAGMLAGAWGVMYGQETTEVVLRFSAQVARRVQESRWHASQELEECAGGGCIVRFQVPHVVEMKPWIRGWGPECEVLAPEGLRAEVAEEMRRAAEVYGRPGASTENLAGLRRPAGSAGGRGRQRGGRHVHAGLDKSANSLLYCEYSFLPLDVGPLARRGECGGRPAVRDAVRPRPAVGAMMKRGRRESDWLVVRRCLAIVRRVQRGPATWRALLEAVLAQEGAEAYGGGPEAAQRLRLEKDLERIRGHLALDVCFDRELGGYATRQGESPLLDLPDEDLATMAWLAETFTPESPQHDQVQALLGRLRRSLPEERRAEIERRHTALVLDLEQRDEDEIPAAVWEGLSRALAGRRRIELLYRSPQQEDQAPRRHLVDPYERYFDTTRGHYYLRGWCHHSDGPKGRWPQNRYYDYRLGRITSLTVLPNKLPPYPPPAPRYAVEYELAAGVARLGVSRLRGIEVEEIERRPDGSAVVRGWASEPLTAVQALLHYGPSCRVLGGPEVVARTRAAVAGMAEMYVRKE